MYSLLLFVVYNAPFFSEIALLGTKMFCFYIIKLGGESAKLSFLFCSSPKYLYLCTKK